MVYGNHRFKLSNNLCWTTFKYYIAPTFSFFFIFSSFSFFFLFLIDYFDLIHLTLKSSHYHSYEQFRIKLLKESKLELFFFSLSFHLTKNIQDKINFFKIVSFKYFI